MKFVIKLFPEITIKSKPVRKQLITQLRRNIKDTLKYNGLDSHVQGSWDNIEVSSDDSHDEQKIVSVLCRIPGVAKVLTVKEFSFKTFDDIFETAKNQYAEQIKGKTFCVRVKRSGQHDFRSVDVERYVGGGLLQHTDAKAVALKNPDFEVKLEIRKQRLLAITDVNYGLGGFPLGCQDSVLSLISGGFDSNVASYLMIKRGLQTHYLFFNMGGTAHEVGVKQVAHYLWETFAVSHGVKFVSVPFDSVVSEILQKVDNRQMGVILKRMMLRVASKIAEQLGIEALVTGESIAQVSSQTLRNLTVIDAVTDTLVIRPLVVMDKPDIIDTSREIGTYEFAAAMPEYCGVISAKPTTRARFEKVAAEEERFDFAVLDQAIENTKIERIQDVLKSKTGIADVELVSTPSTDAMIVDIRHPQEEEAAPLHLTNNEIRKIPFFLLNRELDSLPKDRDILLYCAKGTMSQIHAQELMANGMTNIKVFKP